MIQLDVVDDDIQARINEQIAHLLNRYEKQISELESKVVDLTTRVTVLETP